MTVEELIGVLKTLDQSLRVVMPSEHGEWCEVVRAAEDWVALAPDGVLLAYADEKGAQRAARLFGPGEA